jgi:hypothetical protein
MGATAQSTDQVQQKAQEVAGQAQEKAQKAADQAKTRVREQVNQRSDLLAQQAGTSAEDLRGVSHYLRSQNKPQPAKLADQVADRAQQASSYLQRADADSLLHDVEDLGRRKPWAIALGGAALGFAASRFLKASSTERYRSASVASLGTTGGPQVHTSPGQGHPAGNGARTTRDVGGPVAAPDAPPAAPDSLTGPPSSGLPPVV